MSREAGFDRAFDLWSKEMMVKTLERAAVLYAMHFSRVNATKLEWQQMFANLVI